jgi:hypothetical protein
VLERRQCQIPHDNTAHQGDTTNVIHGAFFTPESLDWVVLCKENADASILAFKKAMQSILRSWHLSQ